MHPNPDGARRRLLSLAAVAAIVIALVPAGAPAQQANADLEEVRVVKNDSGYRLQVDGEDLMVFGMNWGYMPIGQNYTYDFWNKPDDFIKAALESEMGLMKNMGINVIRHYVGMPPRWVQYVYETYGIYTVINHTVGRYGLTLDGVWYPVTDYSDPRVREFLRGEIADLVEEFADTPGMLMWLLGNENNYGLSWSSFEIEALPEGEKNAARAQHLYSLFGEVIRDIKRLDPQSRPVAMANGDLQYIDIIAKECQGLDVFGSNVYRGISARDLYQVVEEKLGVPFLYTEFGADAFNAVTMQEDQLTQAKYLLGQWEEIYEQSAGKGRVGNAIGGLIFQWSDGWWKFRQEERLDIHDTNASWPNAGYPEDYREGDNNMNEEWWGICAKGYSGPDGLYEVYPRAAYYALRDAFRLDPYASGTDLRAIRRHFSRITPMGAALQSRGDTAMLETQTLKKVRVSGLRMEFETFSTGGENITTPESNQPQAAYPSFKGFDHLQSFYADIEAKPNEAIRGRLSLNVLGNVAENPINEIFYENRGRRRDFVDAEGLDFEFNDIERIAVYQAELNWDDRWFMLDAFYRTGHLHWQYEGDFFGLYRDAFYGENLDIYNGAAPIGFEMAGKKTFEGLKVAFGPELWWGANPAVLVKYQRRLGGIDWTSVFQEDFAQRTESTSSLAIPVRDTRKLALTMQKRLNIFDWLGPIDFEGGAIWSGQPRVDETFQLMVDGLDDRGDAANPEDVRQDTIEPEDTFGFKGKLTWQKGRWNWYGQGAYMGLVAEAGPTSIPTFTGWRLRDSGSGNQIHALTGLAVTLGGKWQVGPNFLWQKPIVGPMLHSEDLVGTQGRPRNVLDDPFAVLGNRETTAAEFIVTYDPTPATWMWSWDNDVRENADFAASLGFTVRRHHTTADAGLFISEEGSVFPFPGATPGRDLWEINGRVVNRVGSRARMISHFYYGTAEPRGDDTRLLHRFGLDTRVAWPAIALGGHVKVNDFGPYDYHRDFNQTFPLQLMGDLSYTLGTPEWFDLPQTRVGVSAIYRTLDRYSNRYQPEGEPEPAEGELYPDGLEEGREWEFRTYLHLSL